VGKLSLNHGIAFGDCNADFFFTTRDISLAYILTKIRLSSTDRFIGDGKIAAERLDLRKCDAVAIWKFMEKWLELDSVKAALPKCSFNEAVTYLRNPWDALRHC
jgi:hypothetical protein